MATLVHDDLIDGASLRHGRPAVWSVHGDQAAVTTGDYLFARAFAELATTGDVGAPAILAEAAVALSRGEALQRRQAYDPDTTIESYLERCALKTGKLFEAACGLAGAPASSGSPSASPSRSPTTSSTAPATLPTPARSRAPICARERRRCPSSLPRVRTSSCVRRSPAGRSKVCSSGWRRRARSTRRASWLSSTHGGQSAALDGNVGREELEALTHAAVDRTH